MPVNIEELFNQEEDFELGFSQILFRDGAGHVYPSRTSYVLETPAVEILFLPGKITEKYQHPLPPMPGVNRRPEYAAWLGSLLQFTVTTNRRDNNQQHKVILRKIRKNCRLFMLAKTWGTTKAATVNRIADIREQGSTHGVDTQQDFDLTVINYTVDHNIANDAWPLDI